MNSRTCVQLSLDADGTDDRTNTQMIKNPHDI